MATFQNDLKEMILGDDPTLQDIDYGFFMKQFREFLEPDMFPDFQDDDQQSDEQLEAILDEEEEEIQPIKLQIYEPNTELEIPQDIPQQLYLQQNPSQRTLLKEIGLKTGSMMAGTISSTRQAASNKQYPIYKFTDLYYAASDRAKNIYERVQQEMLYKNRREKKFDQDYYDQLLSSFQVFNEQQLKEYLQKESESIQESLKQKKTQKEIEAQLNKYTKQWNESKDNFFILSQESINYNPYDQLDYNPHINAQFFQELEYIINREQEVTHHQSDKYIQGNDFKKPFKKVKLNEENSKSQQDLGQNKQMEIENEIRQNDRYQTSHFFSKKYELFESQGRRNDQEGQQLLNNVDSYLYQAPKFNGAFKYWGEPEEPGKNLQVLIARQLETDKKQNEQGQDQKFIEIDVETPFKKQKDDAEFQKAIDEYSYYNKEIVEFCQGKKDNFLEKPYETYNRIDISLNQGNFFSEKLEFLLHQKKIKEQPIITNNLSKIAAPSVISKQIENKSLPSKNQLSRGDDSDQEFESDSNLNNNNFPQLMQIEEGTNKELKEQIMLQMKNQQQNQTTTTTVYYNSVVAENFTLNNFSQDIEQHSQYHRSHLVDLLYLDKLQNLGLEREQVNYFDPWNVKMIPTKKIQDQTNLETKFDEFPEKIKSQEYYKHLFQLSLSKGNFILFEYIEQRPLILNNTGMCIKASRYVYPNRALQQFKQIQSQQEDQQLIEFKKFLANKLGQIGIVKFIDRDKQQGIPLQGQLNDEQHIGITIIENDLYRAPIFRQKLPETDFVLVRQKQDDLHYQYALRPVDYIYLVGQIEPKVEIYTPHSRPLGTFLKSCLKTYIKKAFKEGSQIKQDELEKLFPKQSQHNIRTALRECQGQTDQQNQKTWSFQGNDRSILKFDVSPIQVCQHESMLHSCYLLNEFGLQALRNSDKMKKTLQEFLTRHPKDYEDWVIARCIEHELNMTAWSLSTSFLNSASHQGRMLLYGLGDPTSGHGGLSYIKKALKARGEKGTNAIQEKKQSVMGTDNDLRKLHVSDIKKILLQLGKSEEQVRSLKRWKMINLCTKHIQEVLNPDNQNSQLAISYQKNLETLNDRERKQLEVIEKYSKNLRLTTKKQKEQYQKELDSHLNCLIYNLTLTVKSNYFEDFREITNLRQKRKLQKDDKNKDLEYSQQEIEEYLVAYKDRYKIDFKLYLIKDREIWLSKKKKKGLV